MKITLKDLEKIVYQLNTLMGTATEPYTKVPGGYMPNPGNYHLAEAYGGIKLHKMSDVGTSITDALNTGYTTKKELYRAIQNFIAGIEATK
jgi:hypothetical protein